MSTSGLLFQWINSTCAFTTSSVWLSYWYASRKGYLVNLTKVVCSALIVFIVICCSQNMAICHGCTFNQWVFHTFMSRIISCQEILEHWRKKNVLYVVLRNLFQVIPHPHLLLMSGSLSEVLIYFFGLFCFFGKQGLCKPFFLALFILIFLLCCY